jgi:zinc transport system permease protein
LTGRKDAIIGAIWAIGMAIGMIFMAYTPGIVDPMITFWKHPLITKVKSKNLYF